MFCYYAKIEYSDIFLKDQQHDPVMKEIENVVPILHTKRKYFIESTSFMFTVRDKHKSYQHLKC